ncbi:E3 ubiquitin ligase BIG BROTHER-related-like [Forsythia ovata]|uniref:RING-type E3 ubiquitin transferase n=1 Tax=Forsythia ovata TaxID=205694 RepID=A0ABD1R4T4_9LAMI
MAYFAYQRYISTFVPNFHAAPQLITILDQQGNVFRVPSYHAPPSRTRSTTQIERHNRSSSLNEETIIWNESAYVSHLRSNSSTDPNSSHRPNQTVFSEETVVQHLKTRNFVNVKVANENDEEPEICVVCQGEYEENESVGMLRCGHEYHVDCITKWLLQKNVCPICKAEALPTKQRNGRSE